MSRDKLIPLSRQDIDATEKFIDNFGVGIGSERYYTYPEDERYLPKAPYPYIEDITLRLNNLFLPKRYWEFRFKTQLMG